MCRRATGTGSGPGGGAPRRLEQGAHQGTRDRDHPLDISFKPPQQHRMALTITDPPRADEHPTRRVPPHQHRAPGHVALLASQEQFSKQHRLEHATQRPRELLRRRRRIRGHEVLEGGPHPLAAWSPPASAHDGNRAVTGDACQSHGPHDRLGRDLDAAFLGALPWIDAVVVPDTAAAAVRRSEHYRRWLEFPPSLLTWCSVHGASAGSASRPVQNGWPSPRPRAAPCTALSTTCLSRSRRRR